MKRKRDYRWAGIEKVKLRRQPAPEKKAQFSLKLETNQYFFSSKQSKREVEREREGERAKRIRSQAKQETRIINDFCALIWRQGAGRGGGAS